MRRDIKVGNRAQRERLRKVREHPRHTIDVQKQAVLQELGQDRNRQGEAAALLPGQSASGRRPLPSHPRAVGGAGRADGAAGPGRLPGGPRAAQPAARTPLLPLPVPRRALRRSAQRFRRETPFEMDSAERKEHIGLRPDLPQLHEEVAVLRSHAVPS